MRIRKAESLRKLNHDINTILVNLESLNWIKVQDVALQIMDSIDGLEMEEAVASIQKNYQVPADQAEGFINFMVDRQILEKVLDIKHIKLVGEEDMKPLKRIAQAYVHITDLCNLKCGYCYYDASVVEENDLKTHQVRNIIRRLALNNVDSIAFSGGEPLLRKDLAEVLKYSSKFFNDIGIVTNAVLITPEIAKMMGQYVNKVQISLDSGIEEDHDAIRGKGTFKRTVRGIQLLKEYAKDIQIKIAPTINRINIERITSIVDLAKELDVMLEARFFLPSGRGSCNQNQFAIDDDEMIGAFKRIWQRCEEIEYTHYSIEHFYNSKVIVKNACGACEETICVDVNGDLYPCGFLMDEGIKIGNIFDGINIFDMIENSKIGKKVLSRDVDNIPGCQECNVRYFCGGGCMGIAYGETGAIEGRDPKCPYYRKLYEKLVWRPDDADLKTVLNNL